MFTPVRWDGFRRRAAGVWRGGKQRQGNNALMSSTMTMPPIGRTMKHPTVHIPSQRRPFAFESMTEAGKWLSESGKLEENIKKVYDVETHNELETENFIRISLHDAYELRNETPPMRNGF